MYLMHGPSVLRDPAPTRGAKTPAAVCTRHIGAAGMRPGSRLAKRIMSADVLGLVSVSGEAPCNLQDVCVTGRARTCGETYAREHVRVQRGPAVRSQLVCGPQPGRPKRASIPQLTPDVARINPGMIGVAQHRRLVDITARIGRDEPIHLVPFVADVEAYAPS
jgi:hypothetical protein